jgi:prolyl oligopeptidase
LDKTKTNSIQKPETVDLYFDAKVADPYRWLEDDRSAETAAWVEAENKVTYGYLNQIPFRDALKPHGETMEL